MNYSVNEADETSIPINRNRIKMDYFFFGWFPMKIERQHEINSRLEDFLTEEEENSKRAEEEFIKNKPKWNAKSWRRRWKSLVRLVQLMRHLVLSNDVDRFTTSTFGKQYLWYCLKFLHFTRKANRLFFFSFWWPTNERNESIMMKLKCDLQFECAIYLIKLQKELWKNFPIINASLAQSRCIV